MVQLYTPETTPIPDAIINPNPGQPDLQDVSNSEENTRTTGIFNSFPPQQLHDPGL
jgi:hypothetical protein